MTRVEDKVSDGATRKSTGWWLAAIGSVLLVAGPTVSASPITLQNATADFSQSSFTADQTIDGVTGPSGFFNGWAINPQEGNSHTIVWETGSDVFANSLKINLIQNFGGQHLIGRFRLSTTTDNRTLFADGLTTGGDVTANWSVLSSPIIDPVTGLSFTTLGDDSVLVSPNPMTPQTATYVVSFSGLSLSGVTGLRLEVLTDASLPFTGPGLQPTNGNFVLTEVTAAVSEPITLALLSLGLIGTGIARRKLAA